MKMSNNNVKRIVYCIFFLFIASLLKYNYYFHFLYTRNNHLLPYASPLGFSTRFHKSPFINEEQLDCVIFTSNQSFNPIKQIRMNKKFNEYWIRFLYYGNNIKLTQFEFTALFLSGFIALLCESNKRIPVIAFFVSGHDPPNITSGTYNL